MGGYDGLSIGGHFKYDVGAQAAKDYNAGIEYGVSDFALTAKTTDRMSKVTLGYLHRYSPALQLGVHIQPDLKDPSKSNFGVGTSYAIDQSAAIKAKIDAQGVFGEWLLFPMLLSFWLEFFFSLSFLID